MRSIVAVLLIGCAAFGGRASAQVVPAPAGEPSETLRVFIDCPDGCDRTFLRTELNFIDHVTQREVADVHILVTESDTGGGGTEFTVALIGLGRFSSTTQTLKYVSQPGDTDDAERRGVLRAIKLGLVPFLSKTPLASRVDVTVRPPGGKGEDRGRRSVQTTSDPWNFWAFHIQGDTDLSGEESSKSVSFDGSLAATRVTELWKTSINFEADYRRNTYDLDEEDEEPYTTISRNSELSGLQVKSLGPHWGAGFKASRISSTYTNHDWLYEVSPAVEYNIYPYAETSRRQLTLTYSLGFQYAKYRQVTVYGKLEEALARHELALNWDMKQPWGTLDIQIEASQYIPETDRNRLSIEADAEIRLFKGFSLDVGADVAFIRDQVYLPARGATDEEILLRLRQIATSYEYRFSIGFSYSFGSVYNNVVNTRLSGF